MTLIFVLSVAITAGSILVASALRNTLKSGFFSTLIFFLAFYFTSGFYVIWGQVILIFFLSPILTGEMLGKTSNILALLGSPFVVFAWLMLLRLTREMSGGQIRNSFVFWFLSGNTLLGVSIVYSCAKFVEFDSFTIIRYGIIILNLVYFTTGAAFLRNKKNKSGLRHSDNRNIAAGLMLIMLFQNGILISYNGNIYIALVFILVFFLGGAFLPFYIRYRSDLSIFIPEQQDHADFDTLCKNFEISPREKDIMREICNGLSNQQIADKLFISLQTVKDHSSRIYYKTNCTGRAQLITMVQGKI
jgi:DNA-binding CsgD family transcriptional regulator